MTDALKDLESIAAKLDEYEMQSAGPCQMLSTLLAIMFASLVIGIAAEIVGSAIAREVSHSVSHYGKNAYMGSMILFFVFLILVHIHNVVSRRKQ
jgi:hypothetical protein